MVRIINFNLWEMNPEGALFCNQNRLLGELHATDHDLSGFSDAAYVLNDMVASYAGMGGFLRNRKNKVLFFFSGRARVETVVQAELEAALFLIQALKNSSWKKAKCVLYLDSVEVHDIIMKCRACYVDRSLLSQEAIQAILNPFLAIKVISRKLN